MRVSLRARFAIDSAPAGERMAGFGRSAPARRDLRSPRRSSGRLRRRCPPPCRGGGRGSARICSSNDGPSGLSIRSTSWRPVRSATGRRAVVPRATTAARTPSFFRSFDRSSRYFANSLSRVARTFLPSEPELLQDLLDLVGQELRRAAVPPRPGSRVFARRKRRFGPPSARNAAPAATPAALTGLALDLGGDVDGRPAGGLEPIELGIEIRAGRYDLRESGIRARTHSIVSFVMSMVFWGTNRFISSSPSTPRCIISTRHHAAPDGQSDGETDRRPDRGRRSAIAVSTARITPRTAPSDRPPTSPRPGASRRRRREPRARRRTRRGRPRRSPRSGQAMRAL